MEGEMVTGTGVVSVGAALASWMYRGVADSGEEVSRLRVMIKCGLFAAAARANETACGVPAAHFFIIGHGDGAGDGTVEAKARFRQEAFAYTGTGQVIKDGAASLFHQRGIENGAWQGLRMDGNGACFVHRKSPEARSGICPEVRRWRECDGGDLRPERGWDFIRCQLVALASELHATVGLTQFCAEARLEKSHGARDRNAIADAFTNGETHAAKCVGDPQDGLGGRYPLMDVFRRDARSRAGARSARGDEDNLGGDDGIEVHCIDLRACL